MSGSVLLTRCRQEHAFGGCAWPQYPLRGGVRQAHGQPAVQRQLRGEGEGQLRAGRQVGRGTYPRLSLPHHCALEEP